MIKVGDIVYCTCGCDYEPVKIIQVISPFDAHARTGAGIISVFGTKTLVIKDLTRLERIVYGFHTEEK